MTELVINSKMTQYLQKHQSIHRQIQRKSTISFIYLLISILFLNPFIQVLTLTTQTFQYYILLIDIITMHSLAQAELELRLLPQLFMIS